MRAINHALTGSLIGLTITRPVIALALAIISHYICDMIPHHNGDLTSMSVQQWLNSKKFRILLYADALLCFGLVLLLAFTLKHPTLWLLPAICAFLAAAPDFASFNRYYATRRGKPWTASRYVRFADGIQWFGRPIGAVVELAWFGGTVILLLPFLQQ